MVIVHKKVFFISIFEVWNSIEKNVFKLFCFCSYKNIDKDDKVPFFLIKGNDITIENDLRLDNKMIFSGFSKPVRNAIQQAKKKNIFCSFRDDKITFYTFFNSFAQEKRLRPISMKFLNKIGNNLFISFAEHNGEIYAAHCYIVDFDVNYALLFRSASRRLFDNSINPNEIGKANKLLHYEDMIYFKSLGITTYGFGGYAIDTKSDSKHGINKFKSYFGGQIAHRYYYYTIPYFIVHHIKATFYYLFERDIKHNNYRI